MSEERTDVDMMLPNMVDSMAAHTLRCTWGTDYLVQMMMMMGS